MSRAEKLARRQVRMNVATLLSPPMHYVLGVLKETLAKEQNTPNNNLSRFNTSSTQVCKDGFHTSAVGKSHDMLAGHCRDVLCLDMATIWLTEDCYPKTGESDGKEHRKSKGN